MAIYHFHAKMVSRAKGESTVAGAAYRSGSRIYEVSTGITHDYMPETERKLNPDRSRDGPEDDFDP
jgi:hypothetical protein